MIVTAWLQSRHDVRGLDQINTSQTRPVWDCHRTADQARGGMVPWGSMGRHLCMAVLPWGRASYFLLVPPGIVQGREADHDHCQPRILRGPGGDD